MSHAARTVTARTLGRYELLQEIGRGGMASVHLGRTRGLAGFERTVAIKCCHPAMAEAPDTVKMFLDEARLAAKIHHPNVVATLDVGHDDVLYLVMEYIEGDKLSTLITAANRRGERIPVPIALRILIDALAGLHAAHTLRDGAGRPLGIVHRDVSPQNILVGADGVTRIADFGIANAEAQVGSPGHGAVLGKLGYIAPERFGERDSFRLCDVFAAGVVLWETLTGVRLFHASTDVETVEQVMRCDVPPPSELEPSLPTALDAIVLRAVERAPEARYPTAQDFALALENGPVRPATGRDVADYVAHVLGTVLAARRDFVAQLDAPDGEHGAVSDEAVTRLWNPTPEVALRSVPDAPAPVVDAATEPNEFVLVAPPAVASAPRSRTRLVVVVALAAAALALTTVGVRSLRERAPMTAHASPARVAPPPSPPPAVTHALAPPPAAVDRAPLASPPPPPRAVTTATRARAASRTRLGVTPVGPAHAAPAPATRSPAPRRRPTDPPREFHPGVV